MFPKCNGKSIIQHKHDFEMYNIGIKKNIMNVLFFIQYRIAFFIIIIKCVTFVRRIGNYNTKRVMPHRSPETETEINQFFYKYTFL